MKQTTKLNLCTGLYSFLGLLICAVGFINVIENPIELQLIFFVLLSIVAESLIIQFSKDQYISAGFAVSMASLIIFNPGTAAVIVFLGSLLKVYYEVGFCFFQLKGSFYKRIYSASIHAIGTYLSACVYHEISKQYPYGMLHGFNLLGMFTAICVYISVHLLLLLVLHRVLERRTLKNLLKDLKWVTFNLIAMAPIGIIMAIAFEKSGWFMVTLILGPLIMARYSFKLYIDMKQQYFDTIKTLSNALDAKDNYTNGHSMRVAEFSVLIAAKMQMLPNQIEVIKTAAVLHDIGKIGIADAIINKPGRLEMNEIYEIRRHPEIGDQILKDVKALKKIAKIVKHHHERYDGNGYPDSLMGEEIPRESAIISVADAFDAMTSNRIYRLAMTEDRAIEAIRTEKGLQFHPEVVEAFEACVDEFITRFAEKHEEESLDGCEEIC